MSMLPDGDFDLAFSFTDPAGNKSVDYTRTYHKDVSIPTCDLSFGQTAINSSNKTAASFRLDNISEDIPNAFMYTISDGTNSVGDLDSFVHYDSTSTGTAIKNIDFSSLSDGTLMLTVKVYDYYMNSTTYTATIIKDTIAPTVILPAISTSATSSAKPCA